MSNQRELHRLYMQVYRKKYPERRNGEYFIENSIAQTLNGKDKRSERRKLFLSVMGTNAAYSDTGEESPEFIST